MVGKARFSVLRTGFGQHGFGRQGIWWRDRGGFKGFLVAVFLVVLVVMGGVCAVMAMISKMIVVEF